MTAATNMTDAKLKALIAPASGQHENRRKHRSRVTHSGRHVGYQNLHCPQANGGKLKNITVGRFTPRLGLAEARKKARTVLSDIDAGNDPSARAQARGQAGKGGATVRTLWPRYKAEKAHLRTIVEVERTFVKYILTWSEDRQRK